MESPLLVTVARSSPSELSLMMVTPIPHWLPGLRCKRRNLYVLWARKWMPSTEYRSLSENLLTVARLLRQTQGLGPWQPPPAGDGRANGEQASSTATERRANVEQTSSTTPERRANVEQTSSKRRAQPQNVEQTSSKRRANVEHGPRTSSKRRANVEQTSSTAPERRANVEQTSSKGRATSSTAPACRPALLWAFPACQVYFGLLWGFPRLFRVPRLLWGPPTHRPGSFWACSDLLGKLPGLSWPPELVPTPAAVVFFKLCPRGLSWVPCGLRKQIYKKKTEIVLSSGACSKSSHAIPGPCRFVRGASQGRPDLF